MKIPYPLRATKFSLDFNPFHFWWKPSFTSIEELADYIGERAISLKVRTARSLPDVWVSAVVEGDDSNWIVKYHSTKEEANAEVTSAKALAASPSQPGGWKVSVDIDYKAAKAVDALIEQVRAAGFTEAAEVFSNTYWGWLRLTSAYVSAHPYVAAPEAPTMTPISALSVTDFTLNHWSPLVPGTPSLDDTAVLRAAEADEEWHRQEDWRMRRDAGEDLY